MPWVWHTLAQWLRCTSLFYTEKYWNSKKISSRKWNFNWGLLYFEVPAISSIPKLTCHKKSMKNIWIILTREKFLNCAYDEISFFFLQFFYRRSFSFLPFFSPFLASFFPFLTQGSKSNHHTFFHSSRPPCFVQEPLLFYPLVLCPIPTPTSYHPLHRFSP